MFGEFAEKLMDEGYSVKRVNPRNWFRQGVFLWNVFPTTIDKDTRQHEGLGWGRLMGELIETLYLVDPNTLFVFFGHKLDPFIDLVPVDSTTLFFELPDPIDNLLFHDQEIFGRINRFLKAQNRDAINWSLI
jgi:uracil DNA glycosylase